MTKIILLLLLLVGGHRGFLKEKLNYYRNIILVLGLTLVWALVASLIIFMGKWAFCYGFNCPTMSSFAIIPWFRSFWLGFSCWFFRHGNRDQSITIYPYIIFYSSIWILLGGPHLFPYPWNPILILFNF